MKQTPIVSKDILIFKNRNKCHLYRISFYGINLASCRTYDISFVFLNFLEAVNMTSGIISHFTCTSGQSLIKVLMVYSLEKVSQVNEIKGGNDWVHGRDAVETTLPIFLFFMFPFLHLFYLCLPFPIAFPCWLILDLAWLFTNPWPTEHSLRTFFSVSVVGSVPQKDMFKFNPCISEHDLIWK